jgi:pimeloyl-ACP methyl ester carboxylesterase
METFDWEGRRIAWESAGSGPAVVFCHGTPWSSWLWRPFAEALSEDFTVYLWDMPGYGRSSKDPAHAVGFGVQAEAFGALLAHWDLDRPHVVAHDYGGAVSLRATLVHGVPYASLLLADVVAIPPSGSPFFQLVKEHPDVLAQVPPYIHEALVRAGAAGPPGARAVGRRGHVDPDRHGRAARRGHPRRDVHPGRRRGPPHPAGRPGHLGDRAALLADPRPQLSVSPELPRRVER